MLETSADIDFYVIMKSYFSDGAGIGAISSGGRAIIGAEEKLFDTRMTHSTNLKEQALSA